MQRLVLMIPVWITSGGCTVILRELMGLCVGRLIDGWSVSQIARTRKNVESEVLITVKLALSKATAKDLW
jgi:hypothetical protein